MLLEAENLSYSYGRRGVLHGVSLSVTGGEIVSLLGPNGSGKSTLLKLLLGLKSPQPGGTVRFEGHDLKTMERKALARRMAYLPQSHKAAFAFSVLDVVLMGRMPHQKLLNRYGRDDLELGRRSLSRMSILHLAERPYTELSGGERQLALLARALTQGARTLILDEPTSGLDYGNQIRLLEELLVLRREGYTFIKSTHCPDHALWVADRVLLMKEGRIVDSGPPRDTLTAEKLYHLYGRELAVRQVEGGLSVCVPSRLGQPPQEMTLCD